MKACQKLILSFFDGMVKHSQSSQNSKFVMSFQYLQKEVMTGVHYGVHQDSHFSQLDYRFLIKADMSKVPKKRSLLRFCNILRKSMVAVFAFYCDSKYSDTLQGPSHVCYYLFLQTFQLSRYCQVSPSLWYAVTLFRIESICTGFYISHQKNFHIYIIFHRQCKTIHLQ